MIVYSKTTKPISKIAFLLFILIDSCCLFFLPIAWIKSDAIFSYVTLWDMIWQQSVYVLPNVMLAAHYSIDVLLPYIIFSMATIINLISMEKKGRIIFSLLCVVVSFIQLCLVDKVTLSIFIFDEGGSFYFNNESWIFVYIILYLSVLIFLLYNLFRPKYKNK